MRRIHSLRHQALVLLESVASQSKFQLDDFAARWRTLFKDYNGYFDRATKAALESFSLGKSPAESGSPSTDLAGASRIAPLVYRYMEDLDSLLLTVRAQTAMTHGNPVVIMAAEYFARVVFEILKGGSPVAVMKEVVERSFQASPIEESISAGIASSDDGTRDAILKFGQACGIAGALPSTVHLIARYESSLRDGLIENVMAGGDSAARGLIVGMVLGAHLGSKALPAEWVSSLKLYQHISALLEKIDKNS